jgi:hypothetical protein
LSHWLKMPVWARDCWSRARKLSWEHWDGIWRQVNFSALCRTLLQSYRRFELETAVKRVVSYPEVWVRDQPDLVITQAHGVC